MHDPHRRARDDAVGRLEPGERIAKERRELRPHRVALLPGEPNRLGGRERSEDDWRKLLAANGFRLETPAVPGLLEATLA